MKRRTQKSAPPFFFSRCFRGCWAYISRASARPPRAVAPAGVGIFIIIFSSPRAAAPAVSCEGALAPRSHGRISPRSSSSFCGRERMRAAARIAPCRAASMACILALALASLASCASAEAVRELEGSDAMGVAARSDDRSSGAREALASAPKFDGSIASLLS
jgi:hypothetical protein